MLAAALPVLHTRLAQHLERHGRPEGGGLLEGRAGIELVQHASSTARPPATRWDACLLLA